MKIRNEDRISVRIAVRLDDITPDMDWERFFAFKELLDRYQIKPLIGVVPDNQDAHLIKKDKSAKAPEDFPGYLKELKEEGWQIAMHGYQHIYTTSAGGLFPLNDFSEFAGLPFEKQSDMLRAGREQLLEQGIETDIFMAPAHSYDKNTLRALKENGFFKITDGFGSRPYLFGGITFYPISFHLEKTLKKKTGYSTLVIHTDTVSESDLERYAGYFKRTDVEWIAYEEYLKQPAVKKGFFSKALEWCMAKGKYLIGKRR